MTMTKRQAVLAAILAFALLVPLMAQPTLAQGVTPSSAVGTEFTYQGFLTDGGSAAAGSYDLQFLLYDAALGGTQIGGSVHLEDVAVVDGLFTVQLDFGLAAFTGEARWLQIGVRPGDSTAAFTSLSPRQPLTATPYALYALGAPWSGLVSVPAGFADGVDNDTTYGAGAGLILAGATFSADSTYLQRRVDAGCPPGSAIRSIGSDGSASCQAVGNGDITAVDAGTGLTGGGDSGEVSLALDTSYTDSQYWRLSGNGSTTPAAHFLGTTDDVSLTLAVDSTAALRLEPNEVCPNLVGGSVANEVLGGVVGGVIGGGGSESNGNRVTDNHGTVGGGQGNRSGDSDGNVQDATNATVSGGDSNVASGSSATVSGGSDNSATGDRATVGGGDSNVASGSHAAIGGGDHNTASHSGAIVSGGGHNIAAGNWAAVGGGLDNDAVSEGCTVAGGMGNTAQDLAATVGGGSSNQASGQYASVCGGSSNLAGASFATIAGGGPSDPASPSTSNHVTDDYGTVGGGGHNQAGDSDANVLSATYATVGGGKENTASGRYSTVAGGESNLASFEHSTVGGGYRNSAPGMRSAIGGGQDNAAEGAYSTVTGGYFNQATAHNATVSGGEGNSASGGNSAVGGGIFNQATSSSATVSGGEENTASGEASTVAGGQGNQASAEDSAISGGTGNSAAGRRSAIGGGMNNDADGDYSTVAGGYHNQATGDYATIGGGFSNSASGHSATVPGGGGNEAEGNYSLAAGRNARANHEGTFVWADSTSSSFASTRADQFLVRAEGGVKMVKGASSLADNYAALQVENYTTSGEAAWFRLASSSSTVPVLKVLKNPDSSSSFLMGRSKSPSGTEVTKFWIDSTGAYHGPADFAEALPAAGGAELEAGDVLVASSAEPGRVERSTRAYDGTVIGVYSSEPGFVGHSETGVQGSGLQEIPVAVLGTVPTKATAEAGPIQPGDLLTTSSTPGHAMRCEGLERCFGRVIGKALEPLSEGSGVIRILVSLQ
jgi:hypothetical protein